MPWNLSGSDTFPLSAVYNVVGVVVEQCLVRNQEVGYDFPGRGEMVEAGIFRTNGRWWRAGVDAVRKVGEWKGVVLWEASGGKGGRGRGEGLGVGVGVGNGTEGGLALER